MPDTQESSLRSVLLMFLLLMLGFYYIWGDIQRQELDNQDAHSGQSWIGETPDSTFYLFNEE